MWDFSGDEWFFFIASAVMTIAGSGQLLMPFASTPGRGNPAGRFLLVIASFFGLGLTYLTLSLFSDSDVKGHADYYCLFLLGGCAWLIVCSLGMPLVGLSIRDDVIERSNPAAVAAATGALAALGIIYAASNIGGGPTIWTTIFPAAGATLGLAVVWWVTELVGRSMMDDITIGRDTASGIRLGGGLVGCGMILGRAAAGNFVSWDQTWGDFLCLGWPAVLLGIAIAVVHRIYRPTVLEPKPAVLGSGFISAILFVLAGEIVVALCPHALHPSQW